MYTLAIFCGVLAAVNAGVIPQQTLAYSAGPGLSPGFAPGLAAGFAPGLAYSAPALAYPSAPAQFAPTAYSFSFQNRGSSIVPYGPYGAVAAPGGFAYAAPAPSFGYAAPPGLGIQAGGYTLAGPAGVTYAAAAPAGLAL